MKKLLVLVMLAALVLPLSASAATPVTYTAGFQLQNLSGTVATVVVDFYNPDGTQTGTTAINDTIPANGSKTYYPLSTVNAGFNGSAVVSSDQQIAAITNVLGNNGQRGAAYGGFSAGATTVSLPLVTKAYFGIDTWFNVQNAGSADATVSVAYAPGTCTDSFTIKPGAAHTFDQSATACLPAGFVGGAKITSNQPIVAVAMQVNASALLAYSGFTATSTNPVFPLVSSNFYYSGTGIAIQNTTATPTNVTITYTPSGGGLPGNSCTETKPIPGNATVTFAYMQLPAACGTKSGVAGITDTTNGAFVGSAKVTTNSAGVQLAAIVNEVTRNPADQTKTLATADSYNAVDPATATNRVSLPLMMDRNFNIFTGFSIVNVGTVATNINCAFTGGYSISATAVAPGGAFTAAQKGQIGSGYVGSAVCTASAAGAKIAGIVNEVTDKAPASTDALLVYPAFSY